MLNDSIVTQKINKKIENQPTLSIAHIRPEFEVPKPQIDYVEGASLLRTTKGRKMEAFGGGRRGGIKGFSRNSRRRLLGLIASVKRDAPLPCFVTLTYPNDYPTVEKAKRDLKVFEQRLKRKYPEAGYIWKLEPQKRGAPHYHMLLWGVKITELLGWVVDAWYEVAGNGDPKHKLFHMGALRESQPCVGEVRSFKGVWSYASKYIGKTFEVAEWGKQWTGRFWGVGGKENIPFGEKKTVEITRKQAVQFMRYQKRFMKVKIRRDLNSLKTFCDADFWINALL